MEKKNKKLLIIALTLSLITVALIYIYISGIKTERVPETEYIMVYAAARTIPEHARITDSDIEEVQITKELFSENMMTDKDQVTGRRALQSIIEGEFIRKERLADEERMNFTYTIPDGTRAVSMNITEEVNVANLLRPGDYVDVVASFEKEDEVRGSTTVTYPRITKIILQNVKVLALGQDTKISFEKLQEQPMTITLAIKKDDVEKFVYASEFGIIRLALRHAGDGSLTDAQGIIRPDVTGMKGVIVTEDTDDIDETAEQTAASSE
jgi:pilus assembly protein CpaB